MTIKLTPEGVAFADGVLAAVADEGPRPPQSLLERPELLAAWVEGYRSAAQPPGRNPHAATPGLDLTVHPPS